MNPRQKAEKFADTECAKYIKERDKVCIICKTRPSEECAHYIGRGKKSTRWDENNCHGLCHVCHVEDHLHPGAYNAALIDLYGEEVVNAIIKKGFAPMKRTVEQINDIAKDYRAKRFDLFKHTC